MAPVTVEEDSRPGLKNTRSRATRLQPSSQEPRMSSMRCQGSKRDKKVHSQCSQSAPEPLPSERSQRMHRRLLRTAMEHPNKRERSQADRSCEDEEKTAKKINLGEEEEEAVSSAPSSPLLEPLLPYKVTGYDSYGQEINEAPDMDIFEAYLLKEKEFEKKIARQLTLPTLNPSKALSLFDPNLLEIRVSATKAVLGAAKFVLGLSSSIDGKSLSRNSGFLIDWNEIKKLGIVMTTCDIICSKSALDSWSGEDEYSPKAKVSVHLLDDSILEAHLIYFQPHYNLALFEISWETPVQFPSFSPRIDPAEHIFMLGRDEDMILCISHGRCGLGGIVIDLQGDVVGMTGLIEAFIPSSIILKCLELWHKFQCIPRPQLGLKLWAIKFLDIPHVEMIWRKIHISDGLIVKEVSEGSVIEKLGVRVGDIIEHINGTCICDTIQVGVFHTRKGTRSIITSTTNVSANGEIVKQGTFFVTIPTCGDISTPIPLEESALGEEGLAEAHIPTIAETQALREEGLADARRTGLSTARASDDVDGGTGSARRRRSAAARTAPSVEHGMRARTTARSGAWVRHDAGERPRTRGARRRASGRAHARSTTPSGLPVCTRGATAPGE
uniref:PDZ domain-containing protein n=1 Tax=Leersia perrieri TaxID=77586 RepID=A0A0D9WCR0_9ORYZ